MNYTKRIAIVINLMLLWCVAYTQEVVWPIGKTPIQSFGLNQKSEATSLKKNGGIFPLVDFFTKLASKPDTLIWRESNATLANRSVVFNTLDSTNNVYPQTAAQADELESKTINLQGQSDDIFINFSYVQGPTAGAGDSLVLFGKDIFGQWIVLWTSLPNQLSWREVSFNLPKETFQSAGFAVKFVLYSDNYAVGNNASFALSKFALSAKTVLGNYDNFSVFEIPDSVPPRLRYAAPDVRMVSGPENGINWGFLAQLDIKDANRLVYAGADNSYGGNDTLFSHPINVSANLVADSIFYGFSCKASANAQAGDSLIVEFKNNLGVWVRMLALGGNQGQAVLNYQYNINFGRNRHGFFQARFIFISTRSAANTAHWLIGAIRLNRKIELPLFDDFSFSNGTPDRNRWADKQVHINNTFPIEPPSVNVATFDGLNENGIPYSPFPLKGICDRLTTYSFNLSGLKASDSLILSFYYQYEPQGTTNQVYPDDSLIVEFRNSRFGADSFEVIKMFSADDSLMFKFHYFSVAVTDPKYFHDDFQIRFKNKGSLTGNLSHWHLDYVRFNRGRTQTDVFKDISLGNAPVIYLGEYSAMPWNHYQTNKAAYRNKRDTLRLVNHDNQAYAIDYFRSVMRPEGDTLDKFVQVIGSFAGQSATKVEINKPFDFATSVQADTLLFETKYKVKISGTALDNAPSNDTFTVRNIFSNYFAYDDGSAEGGYGVENKTNVGACLKYKIPVPDSIVGIYVFYNRSEQDVSLQRFNLKIWKKISPLFEPATSDEVIWSLEQIRPLYTSQRDGFTAYRLPKAVAVSDSFYIGWDQVSAFVLNIGLDKNYPLGKNPNMAYKMDGRWYPTEIDGALMIRPIMGSFLGTATNLPEMPSSVHRVEPTLYPNPARNYFKVEIDNPALFNYKLFDSKGSMVAELTPDGDTFILPEGLEGFYIFYIENKETKQIFAKKLIIQAN
jgi:hypothetical protein